MKPTHVKNYMQAMGFTDGDFMPCEACSMPGNEVHHVEPRSSFGSKRKAEQDHHSNLVLLCRPCHNDAHGPNSREIKEVLKRIVSQRSNYSRKIIENMKNLIW